MIDVSKLSTFELLGLLLGRAEAARLEPCKLDELIRCKSGNPAAALKLGAARELVSRWLEEDLRREPVLSDPKGVRDYLRLLLAREEREVFVVLFLDAQNRLLGTEKLFYGTLAQTSVYPREVVKQALRWNAGAAIFAHNHPSGVAEPSQADQMLTDTLKRTLALVDVKVLDHFIVGDSSAVSFAERGLL
jgi:DNA repair protein RadC